MQSVIDNHHNEIADLCRRFKVRRLDLFGSASQREFDHSRSDVDLLVEFDPAHGLKALDQYFGLKEALERLLGRSVDLVVESAVKNPYLRKSIEETRKNLYAAWPQSIPLGRPGGD